MWSLHLFFWLAECEFVCETDRWHWQLTLATELAAEFPILFAQQASVCFALSVVYCCFFSQQSYGSSFLLYTLFSSPAEKPSTSLFPLRGHFAVKVLTSVCFNVCKTSQSLEESYVCRVAHSLNYGWDQTMLLSFKKVNWTSKETYRYFSGSQQTIENYKKPKNGMKCVIRVYLTPWALQTNNFCKIQGALS